MTHEEKIEYDLRVYGMAFERQKEDGTIERLDPTMVRVIRRPDGSDSFIFKPNKEDENILTPS